MKTPECLGRMDDKGITLTELLIVVGIIGILAVALGFIYTGWMGPYKMEKATKDLYTSLMSARSLALTQNRMYFVTLVDANNYSVTADTNDSTTLNAGDLPLATYPKRVEYPLNWNGAAPANRSISFDKRGIINLEPAAVWVDSVISLTTAANVDPDYNCIVISQTRIRMGKWNLGTGVCDAK